MRSSQKVVVGCRVRPLLSPEDDGKEVCVFPHKDQHQHNQRGKSPFSTDSNKQQRRSPSVTNQNQDEEHEQEDIMMPPSDFYSSLIFNSKKKFTFDQVFFPDDNAPPTSASSPVGIFSSMVLPLIDAATIDAYNSSLLLYGQTGAGKSHTLSSLIHPVVTTLIDRVGCQNLMFRMIEIQNDNLRDLLAAPNQQQKLQLRDAGLNHHNNNNNNNEEGTAAAPTTTHGSGVQLSGATLAVIESEDDAIWLFQEAFRRRATAPTGMNASSSRSHAIFSIFITFPDGRVTKIDLVDLAGSERQKKTQNSGKRMKESVGINSDLLALGNVLRAVASNQSHVGYRQCKLTRLLQDSIGGRSITTFLACVSPLTYNKDESLRTLQYSAVASSIVNTPVQVVAPPPPPVPVQSPENQQQQQQQSQSSPENPTTNKKSSDGSKSSPENNNNNNHNQSCQQCKVLAAALDRSETHAFNLENQIADMNETLQHAQSDLKKDERIFVMKFKEARDLSKENQMLKKRIEELEAQLSMKNKNDVNNEQQQPQQQQQQQADSARVPTSSRFASARIRGPCFSYDFEQQQQQQNHNDNKQEEDEEEQELPYQNRIEVVPQKMTDESRKLVVLASIDSNTHNSAMKNHNHNTSATSITSPFSFQQILMKKKMMSMMTTEQQQHQQKEPEEQEQQEEEDGPIYSLSPSPQERPTDEDNFSRTFVSSCAANGSRHLNFDTTSMLHQHQPQY